MRDPENIRAVTSLGVDMIGLIFYKKSSRYVSQINTNAGIIPDRVSDDMVKDDTSEVSRVGVFVDEMMQTIVTRAYNFQLDYIQLHGDESVTYIDNLRRTLDPDIRPGIKIIKAISITNADDLKKVALYEGHVDLLLFDTKCPTVGGSGEQFDWSVLDGYDGQLPFILSGGIGPEDVEKVKAFHHDKCIGIDLNSKFETAPAVKDIEKLRQFVNSFTR